MFLVKEERENSKSRKDKEKKKKPKQRMENKGILAKTRITKSMTH